MIVADSDVLIDALRGREPAKSRIAAQIRQGSLATTSVSVFELFSGVKDDIHRAKVERLLAALVLLPFDERAGIAAAEIRKTLESKGLGSAWPTTSSPESASPGPYLSLPATATTSSGFLG